MTSIKTIIYLTIFCFISYNSYSHNFDTSKNCDRIKEIKFSNYKANFLKSQKLQLFDTFKKTKGVLTITTKNKTLKFKDEFQDKESITAFSVFGQIKDKHWVFIKELGLNNETYYLVNTNSSHIDTLVGEPKIFESEIVCLEGSYTDSPGFIEIYSIMKDKIKLTFKISLSRCKLFSATNPYLKNNNVFLSDDYQNKAWIIKYK